MDDDSIDAASPAAPPPGEPAPLPPATAAPGGDAGDVLHAPGDPGDADDPDGLDAASDPIFQGSEPVESPTKRSTLLVQFFLFPLLIVAASVGVFLFFGAIGGSPKSLSEFLVEIRTGGDNVQKQAVHQLAAILSEERRRVDRGDIPIAEAEYVKGTFRRDLAAAFEESFDDKTVERQIFLATALGLVGDPAFLSPLSKRLAPPTPPDVRRAIARALARLDTDEPVPLLVRLLDDGDELIRNYAIEGLSRRKTLPVDAIEGLRRALADPSEYVQVNAAAALALHGDAAGLDGVARLLDPAHAREIAARKIPDFTVDAPDPAALERMRALALASGLKAVDALAAAHRSTADPVTARVDALKPLVEALARDDDEDVRKLSRQVLDRWRPPQ